MSKMASYVTPGSQRSQPSSTFALPEIGARVSASGVSLRLKDSF